MLFRKVNVKKNLSVQNLLVLTFLLHFPLSFLSAQLPYYHSDAIFHSSHHLSLTGYSSLPDTFDYERGKTPINNKIDTELLHRNSSHPFSSRNFSKTRPRGLAVQESFIKFLPTLSSLIPPIMEYFRYDYYGQVWVLNNAISKTWTIRPPPFL